MSDVLMLWILGGVLALLIGMMVALSVARSLDGSKEKDRQKFAANGSPAWLSGAVSSTFTALAAASSESAGNSDSGKAARDGREQIRKVIAGLAIGGAILMAIVGMLTGDGS